jgi:hypothetical protein
MTSPVIDPGALETLILQVRGVLAGRIVLDDSQEIDEIHVVGSPERNPKQIVRDIESALFVRGGIRVNHRKISLVQLLESSIRPTIERVRLVEIKRSVVEGYDTIAVTLAFGSRTIEGVSQVDGHAPSGGQTQSVSYQEAEAAANATLTAIHELVTVPSQMVIDHVQHQPLGKLEICLVLVTRTETDITESMLGVSIVRKDPLMAVVRAVLDAVNRRLPYLTGQT